MKNVESYLKAHRKKKGALLFVLIDSENSGSQPASRLAKQVEKAGASAILVGGSSATDQFVMSDTVRSIKKSVKIPLILFQGNVTGVVSAVDAVMLSILLHSYNRSLILNPASLA